MTRMTITPHDPDAMTKTPQAPWSVPVSIGDVPETGLKVELQADEATCRRVAQAAGVNAVARLTASFDVHRRGRDGLHVVGAVYAVIGQTCVVSLEPLASEVRETIDLVFGSDTPIASPARPVDVDPEGADPPEPLVNGSVDLGAIATEFLILGVDPYPRKAGAVFQPPQARESPGEAFAALAPLKRSGAPD
jgi:hypothetical protein